MVVASGHYHAPFVPNIPGLREWKRRWPDRVSHSKGYRNPEEFRNKVIPPRLPYRQWTWLIVFEKNVLLIGAGVSALDIAKELDGVASGIYQSARGGEFDISAAMLPPDATRIGEIDSFENSFERGRLNQVVLSEEQPIPLLIRLKSGHNFCEIHRVIICTGYHITYPFLKQYHEDDTPVGKAGETVLVTNGTQNHNLHRDIFYIPDPSLMFVGVSYHTATFTLFEFQAIAIAAVVSGRTKLPTEQDMRREYQKRLKEKGPGRVFHSLRGYESQYVDELLSWINRDLERLGEPLVEGHTEDWKAMKEAHLEKLKLRYATGDPNGDVNPEKLSQLRACL